MIRRETHVGGDTASVSVSKSISQRLNEILNFEITGRLHTPGRLPQESLRMRSAAALYTKLTSTLFQRKSVVGCYCPTKKYRCC